MLKQTVILSAMLILSGCETLYGDAGLVHDRRQAYLTSTNGKKIELPQEMRDVHLSNAYLIPEDKGELKLVSNVTPPGSLAAKAINPNAIINQPALDASLIHAVTLAQGKGLLIKQPYQQAWLSIATALRRQRLPVMEADKDQRFIKIADTFQQEAGVGNDWQLYYLRVVPQGNNETLIRLTPSAKQQRFNKHIESRILARVEDGIKGKEKPKSLLTIFKEYV